jgi:hypothetical protein
MGELVEERAAKDRGEFTVEGVGVLIDLQHRRIVVYKHDGEASLSFTADEFCTILSIVGEGAWIQAHLAQWQAEYAIAQHRLDALREKFAWLPEQHQLEIDRLRAREA